MRSLCLIATLVFATSALFAQSYPTDGSPVSVALADVNRDGYPDMSVVTANSTVDVFLNDHSGGFGSFVSYPVSSDGPLIAIDINGDGWPDLLVAASCDPRGCSYGSTPSSVLLNNRNGTFRKGIAPVTKLPAFSYVAADFNKDGKVDLAAIEGTQIEILLNNGTGGFNSAQVLALSGSTLNAVVGDFDGDGNLDIANAEAKKTLVWWGKGGGTFGVPLQISSPTTNSLEYIATADFNNDGLPDLGVNSYSLDPNCFELPCGSTTAHVYRNLGGRRFGLTSSYLMGDSAGGILYAADLNGDLNQDLVDFISGGAVYPGDLSYRAGNGGFSFGKDQEINSATANEIDFRDLNLDSKLDYVIPSSFPSSEVDVAFGSGYKNCPGASSASLHAKICAPANNMTVTSPLLITAAGNSPVGVQRLEVWVDGKKVYQKLGDQLNKKITLSTGSHRVAVVAVDKYVGYSTSSVYVNVH